ncbi:hypothetical protein CYD53_101595 [Bosea psychrotolerans]|uniref:Uncharacterized protein n=1 Tax=Bosea psychrotolerans TaxID=1871628 RepID=A0A2S4MR19_9HYPH|nr:hypothetical protein CYD53_101595 [Bosea psychrotolerans]
MRKSRSRFFACCSHSSMSAARLQPQTKKGSAQRAPNLQTMLRKDAPMSGLLVRSVSVVTAVTWRRATIAAARPVSVARPAPVARPTFVTSTPVALLALCFFDDHEATLLGRGHGELYSLPVELTSHGGRQCLGRVSCRRGSNRSTRKSNGTDESGKDRRPIHIKSSRAASGGRLITRRASNRSTRLTGETALRSSLAEPRRGRQERSGTTSIRLQPPDECRHRDGGSSHRQDRLSDRPRLFGVRCMETAK